MTNRDRKIEEIREAWITAVKRRQELIKEIWSVETIENKTKELLTRYGEEDFMGMVQEPTTLVANHHCTCSCDRCNFRCRLGTILYGDA